MEENGNRGAALELSRLNATPEEQWRHLRDFLDLNRADLDAMAGTVEILMRHATEFVVSAYDYLLHFKQTAEILSRAPIRRTWPSAVVSSPSGWRASWGWT